MSDETKARIAEIEARERAATLGPWRDITDSIAAQVDADKSFGCTCTAIERAGVDGLGGEIVGIGWYDGPVLTLRAGDADFIAHARADVPWLLARLAAALAARDERTATLEEIAGIGRRMVQYERLEAGCPCNECQMIVALAALSTIAPADGEKGGG